MQNHSKPEIRSFIDIQTPAVPHLKVYPPHTHLMAIFPGLPRWAGTRKVKPIWILLNQETVSGSGISWAMCKSASRSREYHASTPTNSIKALKSTPNPRWGFELLTSASLHAEVLP